MRMQIKELHPHRSGGLSRTVGMTSVTGCSTLAWSKELAHPSQVRTESFAQEVNIEPAFI